MIVFYYYYNLQIIKELNKISDIYKGIRIFNELILDLLGRDTSAALLFNEQTKEKFKNIYVISLFTKRIILFIILLFNLFCIYYAILKGNIRGLNWQMHYLFACITQILIEICIFETMLVIWSHVIIPNMIFNDIIFAFNSLKTTIENIDNKNDNNKNIDNNNKENMNVFNMPDYFFISTRLAQSFPYLIESQIIIKYESIYPSRYLFKQLHKKNNNNNENENNEIIINNLRKSNKMWKYMNYIRKYIIRPISISLLHLISITPIIGQEFIIQIIQPILLAVVFLIIYICLSFPLLFVAAVGGLILISLLIWYIIKKISEKQKDYIIFPCRHPIK